MDADAFESRFGDASATGLATLHHASGVGDSLSVLRHDDILGVFGQRTVAGVIRSQSGGFTVRPDHIVGIAVIDSQCPDRLGVDSATPVEFGGGVDDGDCHRDR